MKRKSGARSLRVPSWHLKLPFTTVKTIPKTHHCEEFLALIHDVCCTEIKLLKTQKRFVRFPGFLSLISVLRVFNSLQFGRRGCCGCGCSVFADQLRCFFVWTLEAEFSFLVSPDSNTRGRGASFSSLSCLVSSLVGFAFQLRLFITLEKVYSGFRFFFLVSADANTRGGGASFSSLSCLVSSLVGFAFQLRLFITLEKVYSGFRFLVEGVSFQFRV